MSFVLSELGLRWRDVWLHVVRPTGGPALVAFVPCLAFYLAVGPQSPWLLPVLAAGSLVYVALFWRVLQVNERAELLTHLPAPVRAVLAA